MPKPSSSPRPDIAIVIAALLLLVFASPVSRWLANSDLPWYALYALWAVLIVLAALNATWRSDEP